MPRKRSVKRIGPSNPMYPMMVHEYYCDLTREMSDQRQARLTGLRSKSDALKYQSRVHDAIQAAFQPRPPRTPLKPRITGTIEIAHCRIEKALFESRPGCLVTGNLYLPHGCSEKNPAPAVIADCGHALDGKQLSVYQRFPQRLAAAGFVTFLIDPFNQGERDQYANLPKSQCADLRADCCVAHNMMGKQLELCGEFFGMWRAWDVIRALDYLLSRPEVDPRHVGMTGNSGGGTMTTWTFPLDERITMAAPSCFITTFARNLENHLPADCEQYPPGVLGRGLELADFIIARAPAPAILLGQNFDFFDRRGLREAYEEVRRFYELIGAPKQNVRLFIGPAGHGFSHHNQEAMVDFFARHAGRTSKVNRLADKECPDLKEKLWVTPKGNVIEFGGTPIYELIAGIARRQIKRRVEKSARALTASVRGVLNIEPPFGSKPPEFRILRPHTFKNYRAARYAIQTERTASASVDAFMQKPKATGGLTLDVEPRVTLYLPHISAEEDLNDKRFAGGLIGKTALYALDVRGLGESLPVEPAAPNFFEPYGYDYMFHGHGILFGRSYLGRRVFDVLRTVDLLISEGAQSIDLYGRGQGAILAAFAGVLAPKIRHVTLRNGPRSLAEWATTPVVRWPAANFPRGVLKHFDISDLIRAMKQMGRRVRVLEPWGVEMR